MNDMDGILCGASRPWSPNDLRCRLAVDHSTYHRDGRFTWSRQDGLVGMDPAVMGITEEVPRG